MIFQQAFYKDREAQTLYMQHLDRVMHRVNTVTGNRYVDDDTILAWEPLNEPQTDGDCSGDDAMISWHHNVSTYIKQQASKQLVTTGFEAKQGERCFKRLHSHATIDFGCAHIWTEIWGHYDMLDASDRSLSRAKQFAKAYLNDVERWSEEIGKPVLLEEFGMARDNWLNKGTMFAYHTNATTGHRDRYFGYLHDLVAKSFANGKPWIGLMPWSYGGSFRSDRQSFNSYGMLCAGDPPQEPPGWFSVLDKDPTMQLIKTWSKS
jgi:mannan endo-1,4-beta-mannosidase